MLQDEPPAPRTLSVVIPAYNEENRLPGTVEAIRAFLVRQGYRAEILIVDDGSIDATFARARDLEGRFPEVRVLRHPVNLGKGAAVRTGVLASTLDPVLFCDADHSTPISNIDRLLPRLDEGFPVAIGSRAQKHSEILRRQPLVRRSMGRIFNGILSLLGVRGIRDTQCGFKLFRADAARALFSALKTRGFAFDVEILIRARGLGYRISEVGVQWTDSPDSRVHFLLKDSARMLKEVLQMRGLL